MKPKFEMGDWVSSNVEWGKGDGIADELSINTAYLVIGVWETGFIRLLDFIEPVDHQYVRFATKKEIQDTKKKYGSLRK